MIKAFQKWIWEDERRKERLEMIFENNFSCVRKRIFDGSFLRFPDMSPAIKLYSYQKDAVARILLLRTLYWHTMSEPENLCYDCCGNGNAPHGAV